jgi:hypothetical protein
MGEGQACRAGSPAGKHRKPNNHGEKRMTDDDDALGGIDDNSDAIYAARNAPAAPVREQQVLGGPPRTPEEIRQSYGYRLIEAQVAATMKSYEPPSLEQKLYPRERR